MDVKTLALILLIGRIIAVTFNLFVLRRQWKLFALPVRPELRAQRITYFMLAIAALAFNIIPVALDVLTLTANLPRSTSIVNPVGVLYSLNACLASLTLIVFVWLLYRLAAKTVLLVDRDKYEALVKKNNE